MWDRYKGVRRIEHRNIQYDIVKGVGIVLVVLGHAIVKEYALLNSVFSSLRTIIYVVHMPLFFCVAGLLYQKFDKRRKNDKRGYMLDKVCLYLVPYLSFSFLIYFISFVGGQIEVTKSLFEKIGLEFPGFLLATVQIITYQGHLDSHLWFAPVMLIILLLATLVDRYFTLRTQMLASFFAYFLSAIYVSQVGISEIIWKVGMYYVFFCAGRYIVSTKLEYKKSISIFVLAICIILRLCCFESSLSIVACLLELFIGVLSMLCILDLSQELSNNICGKGLACIGRHSYIIYLLHQPYIVIGVEKLLQIIGAPVLCCIIFATILGVFVPLFVNKTIISKNTILKFWVLGVR